MTKRKYFISELEIRSQLLIIFLLFIFIAIGSTLCVCLGIPLNASKNAIKYASDSIEKVNFENIQMTSRALSDAVLDSLQVFMDFTLSSALFESFVLNPSQASLISRYSLPSPVLVSELVYREYNFVDGCQYP